MGNPSSKHLKVACLHYFRFKRQFDYVATEVGQFSNDVLAIDVDSNRYIEVEIKVSKSDLLADFKKGKHETYLDYWKSNGEHGAHRWIPQEFYFAVPTHLMSYAQNVIEGLPYGLIEYVHADPRANGRVFPWGDRLRIQTKASKLHNFPASQIVIQRMVKRMSSELCTAYEDMMKAGIM